MEAPRGGLCSDVVVPVAAAVVAVDGGGGAVVRVRVAAVSDAAAAVICPRSFHLPGSGLATRDCT